MAQPAKGGLMWGPIIEKAWAKVKGSYGNVDGGFIENGIRALTGAPVFSYFSSQIRLTDGVPKINGVHEVFPII